MELFILSADNSKAMEKTADKLSQKKFKIIEQENDFILMRKRRFGNPLIHVVSLLLALSVSALFIFINVVYFSYSYLWASPHVLITTKKVGEDGQALEFSDMEEILKKANAIL